MHLVNSHGQKTEKVVRNSFEPPHIVIKFGVLIAPRSKYQVFQSVAFREGVFSCFWLFSRMESLAKTIGRRCATCCAYLLEAFVHFPAGLGHLWPRPENGQTLPKNRRSTSHNVGQSFSQGIPPQKRTKNAKTPLRENWCVIREKFVDCGWYLFVDHAEPGQLAPDQSVHERHLGDRQGSRSSEYCRQTWWFSFHHFCMKPEVAFLRPLGRVLFSLVASYVRPSVRPSVCACPYHLYHPQKWPHLVQFCLTNLKSVFLAGPKCAYYTIKVHKNIRFCP